jgi:hypothetical protein
MAASNITSQEEIVYPLIRQGLFRIDDDGTIWRLGIQYGDRH